MKIIQATPTKQGLSLSGSFQNFQRTPPSILNWSSPRPGAYSNRFHFKRSLVNPVPNGNSPPKMLFIIYFFKCSDPASLHYFNEEWDTSGQEHSNEDLNGVTISPRKTGHKLSRLAKKYRQVFLFFFMLLLL